nr:S-layer homology domain-containing protein [Paenibacillus donghaensis]
MQPDSRYRLGQLPGISASLQAGIVSGRGNNMLAPKANVTRAEVAAMIHRFLQNADLF